MSSDRQPLLKGLRVITTLVFVWVVASAIVAGSSALGFVSQNDAAVSDTHLCFGALENVIRSSDTIDAFSVRPAPEGDALVVRKGSGDSEYEIRIYRHDGRIVQETSLVGQAWNPDGAIPLFRSDSFLPEVTQESVTVSTDIGRVTVSLRSGGDDATERT